MKEKLPTKARHDDPLPEGGIRYRTLFIIPKRDFVGKGVWDNGEWIKEGWLISDGFCNLAPGATWFRTVADARRAIDILIAVRGDGDMFWELYRPFQYTPGENAHGGPTGEALMDHGRFYAKVEGGIIVEVGEKPDKSTGLVIAAYKAKGEEHPVLMVICDGVNVGIAHRRGSTGYDLLKKACNGRPQWLYDQEAQPL